MNFALILATLVTLCYAPKPTTTTTTTTTVPTTSTTTTTTKPTTATTTNTPVPTTTTTTITTVPTTTTTTTTTKPPTTATPTTTVPTTTTMTTSVPTTTTTTTTSVPTASSTTATTTTTTTKPTTTTNTATINPSTTTEPTTTTNTTTTEPTTTTTTTTTEPTTTTNTTTPEPTTTPATTTTPETSTTTTTTTAPATTTTTTTTTTRSPISYDQIINQSLPVNMTGWLTSVTSGYNFESKIPSAPTYLTTVEKTGRPDRYTLCPLIFNASRVSEEDAKLMSLECYTALVQYIGDSDTPPYGNAATRLTDSMTELRDAVESSVAATDRMKKSLDKIVAAVLFRDRTSFGRERQKTILNQEVQLRKMISVIRASLYSVKNLTALDSYQNSLGGNLFEFELSLGDQVAPLISKINATVQTLWEDIKTNIPRLVRLSRNNLSDLQKNLMRVLFARENKFGPLISDFTSLNATEVITMSRIAQQVTYLNSIFVGWNKRISIPINEILTSLTPVEQRRLALTLDQINGQFVTNVSVERDAYTKKVPSLMKGYDEKFSRALIAKYFENSMYSLHGSVTSFLSRGDAGMKALISGIHARVSQLRTEIGSLWDSDKQQAGNMANELLSYVTDLKTADANFVTTSHGLLEQIAETRTDLLSQVRSDFSGKLDDLFKNIVKVLSQMAEKKKAALEDVKGKLAFMDVKIAQLLAASGLSAEIFFLKIDDTVRKMKFIQNHTETVATDARADSTGRTRRVAQSVMDRMSLQEARMEETAAKLQAAREAAQKKLKISNVAMVNEAGIGATDTVHFLASKKVDEYHASSNVKINITNSVLAMGPDFQIAGNEVRSLDSQIKSVVDGTSTLGADQLAGSRVISDQLTEFADVMEQLIEHVYLTTLRDGKSDLEKMSSYQTSAVIGNDRTLTDSIAKMSANLNDTEDPFISALHDVQIPNLQDAIETISQAIKAAWSDFEFDAFDHAIASLNVTTTSDMAAAKSGQAQTFAAKTSEISSYLADLKSRLSTNAPLDKIAEQRLRFSSELAPISSETTALLSSAESLMSYVLDTAKSERAKILALSTNIFDFLLTIGPDFTAKYNSAYARKAAFDKGGSELMMEAGELYTEARQQFSTNLESKLNKANAFLGAVKTGLDSTRGEVAIPTKTSMVELDELINDLLVYVIDLPSLTETVEDENTELMMINVLAPLMKYIALANKLLLTQERESEDRPDVAQIISWTGAVANSTWDTAQSSADLEKSNLMRSSGETALQSQITRLQLAKVQGFLDSQIAETEAIVNASGTATEDATTGVGYALTKAASEIAGTGSKIAATFANATADLSASQQQFSTSIASSDSSVTSLSSGFNSLISGSVTDLMGQFIGMMKRVSQELPETASAAVDVEKSRLARSFDRVTQKVSTTSNMLGAHFQQANTTLRDIQLITKRSESIGATIYGMNNNMAVLENAAVAQANQAADDAIAAEKARIANEMGMITTSLANLKKTASENIAKISF